MAAFAKLRTDLIATDTEVDGEKHVVIKDPITGNFFRLRQPEYWLIRRLDGTRSPADVASAFQSEFGLTIGEEQVEQFIQLLGRLFFLDDNRSEQEIARAARSTERSKSLASRLLFIKVKAFRPGRVLDMLTCLYRPFHTRAWWAVLFGLALLGLAILFANREAFLPSGPIWIFTLGSIPLIILSILIITVVHEYAHAVVCRHYGGEVPEIGFLLMYFQPCFYCNVSDAWLFPRRTQRLAVSLAGPFAQLLLTVAAILVWRVTVPGTGISELARILATISLVSYLFNFNPLLKLDGYYLLADYLELPNLRSRAFTYLKNWWQRLILGWPIETLSVNRRERRVFLTYAILALIYSAGLVGIILYLAGRLLLAWFGGAGLLLLAFALLVIMRHAIADLAKGTITHVTYMKRLLKQPLRLTIYSVLVIGLILVCFLVPIPYRISGDIVVRSLSEYTLALNDAGLIESSTRIGGAKPNHSVSILQMNAFDMGLLQLEPIVTDGQNVGRGDTLAVLLSNQVVQEIGGARAELQRLEGELELLRAPPKIQEVREAESKLSAAKASYDQAKLDFQRVSGLAEKQLVSSEGLDRARSDREIAKAEWLQALSALDLLNSPPRPEEERVLESEIEKQRSRVAFLQTQTDAQMIVAPFSGVVSRRPESGEILTVIDRSEVELLIPVSDFEIGRVVVDQPVSLKVRAYPDRTYFGRVNRIPEAASDISGSKIFSVSALVSNEHSELREGMSGYAKIYVESTSIATYLYRKILSKIRVEFWSWW